MKDEQFYGSGKHPSPGTPLLYYQGQWYEKQHLDYIKSQTVPLTEVRGTEVPKALDKIKSETVSSASFQRKKVIEDSKKEREQQLERLTLMRVNKARLLSDIEKIDKVIASIKQSLEDN